MQCPNCRLVEDGDWLYAAGGFQQAIVSDDLNLEDDQDIEEDDDDDDYFDLTPSMQMYLMHNRLPFPGICLDPPQELRNLHPLAPHFSGPERNVVGPRQNLQRPVHPNPGYITNLQGQAAVGQAHHTCPVPMIHRWPALLPNQVAQQPQHPAVSHLVPTADIAGLNAAFLSQRGNSSRHINLDASLSMGQAAHPPDHAGNVRHPPQQVTGQRMRDRHRHEASTSTEEDVVNIPYHQFF